MNIEMHHKFMEKHNLSDGDCISLRDNKCGPYKHEALACVDGQDNHFVVTSDNTFDVVRMDGFEFILMVSDLFSKYSVKGHSTIVRLIHMHEDVKSLQETSSQPLLMLS